MRDHILFHINGRENRATGSQVFTTLANYLRYDAGATGTKIVCEEGDCGACTVLIRRSQKEQFKPVNACIQLLCQLDGASIVTVEGLKLNGALSAVQNAMVVHHGAQCGYCTPGFIVAMSAMYETSNRVDEKQVRDGLTGNLCRCTGYEPIIKAAVAVDAAGAPKVRDLYPDVPDARDAVRVDNFLAPIKLADAIAFKRDHPGCTIIQGATDVGVWVTKRNFTAPAMLWLGKIGELNELTDRITVGANVTLAAFESFIRDRIPELYSIMNVFGSLQIRHAGTLVGNIANGSPIGDTLPYLFVSDAELELAGTEGTRVVAVSSFYRGYKKFDLKPDEIITRVFIPIVTDTLRLYKVSRRRDLDISAFTAAIRLRISGERIDEARIAYGGVAPTVVRMPKVEEFLTGKPARLETFERAGAIARAEVKPISDVRGSADYRLQLAENILTKFYYDSLGRPRPRREAPAPYTQSP